MSSDEEGVKPAADKTNPDMSSDKEGVKPAADKTKSDTSSDKEGVKSAADKTKSGTSSDREGVKSAADKTKSGTSSDTEGVKSAADKTNPEKSDPESATEEEDPRSLFEGCMIIIIFIVACIMGGHFLFERVSCDSSTETGSESRPVDPALVGTGPKIQNTSPPAQAREPHLYGDNHGGRDTSSIGKTRKQRKQPANQADSSSTKNRESPQRPKHISNLTDLEDFIAWAGYRLGEWLRKDVGNRL